MLGAMISRLEPNYTTVVRRIPVQGAGSPFGGKTKFSTLILGNDNE